VQAEWLATQPQMEAERGCSVRRAPAEVQALRLTVAGGLLMAACVIGVALSVRNGGVSGATVLQESQPSVLTPQQVRVHGGCCMPAATPRSQARAAAC
jgi:hypothetical protein